MNKIAQSKIGLVFMAIMFIILVVLGLGEMLQTQATAGVEKNNLNGFEAFILDNILIIVISVFIIALLTYLSFAT